MSMAITDTYIARMGICVRKVKGYAPAERKGKAYPFGPTLFLGRYNMSVERDTMIGRTIGKFLERSAELFAYCVAAIILRVLIGALAKTFMLSTGGELPVPSVDTLLIVIVGLVIFNHVRNKQAIQ